VNKVGRWRNQPGHKSKEHRLKAGYNKEQRLGFFYFAGIGGKGRVSLRFWVVKK
jgi:hypothetical protein